jgi:hypothetical protein
MSRLSILNTRAIVTRPIVPIVLTLPLSYPPVIVLTHRVAIVLIPIVDSVYCAHCLMRRYCIVTLLSLLHAALDWTST